MFENVFPFLKSFELFWHNNQIKIMLLTLILATIYMIWYTWPGVKNRRIMRMVFRRTGLFTKEEKSTVRIYPNLISYSETDDPNYFVFRYRLQPGLVGSLYNAKNEYFEAAFNAETSVEFKGNLLIIKVNQQQFRH